MSSPLKQIRKRLSFYKQTESLPKGAQKTVADHYVQDITYLMEKIVRLRDSNCRQAEKCGRLEVENSQLIKENGAFHNRLEDLASRYDWYKDVFSPPRVIGNVGRKRRITDNRQEWQKRQITEARSNDSGQSTT
jgi:hypothetical protein